VNEVYTCVGRERYTERFSVDRVRGADGVGPRGVGFNCTGV